MYSIYFTSPMPDATELFVLFVFKFFFYFMAKYKEKDRKRRKVNFRCIHILQK